MPDSIPGGKKRKITIVACPKGVEIAEKALIRLGFDSKINFAESQRLSRGIVTKFFNQQSIQLDSFKKICKALKLNWEEVAGLQAKDGKSESTEERRVEPILSNSEGVESVQTITRVVVPVDEQGQEIQIAAVILEGDINSVQTDLVFWRDILLKQYPGSNIKVSSVKQGSIKLIIEGTQEDIEMLLSDFESGNLTEIEGFPVKDVQLLSESTEDEESSEEKWRLIEEIVTNPIEGRNLSGADLSDADLRGVRLVNASLREADLSDADLSDAKLSDADLIDAKLSRTNLRNADLIGAKLSDARLWFANLGRAYLIGANLRGANLRGANLSDADLSDADLSDADLSDANLSDAKLVLAHLMGAYLAGADLYRADLSGVNLSRANLSRANLSRANLIGANLRATNLSRVIIDNETKIDETWRRVWEIVNQGAKGRNFRGANLVGAHLVSADLVGAYLVSADLSNTDLSDADLNGANLSGANLRNANLSGANLSGANLSGANLSGAYLSGANLSEAKVKNARFGGRLGISETMKQDLIKRGAIFEDSPGERSQVPVKY